MLNGNVTVWDFLCLIWVHLLYSSCFLVAEFLNFYVFSGSNILPGRLLEISLCFPAGGTITQVCGFFPTDHGLFSEHGPCLLELSLTTLGGNIHKKLTADGGYGLAIRPLEVLADLVNKRSPSVVPPKACGQTSCYTQSL